MDPHLTGARKIIERYIHSFMAAIIDAWHMPLVRRGAPEPKATKKRKVANKPEKKMTKRSKKLWSELMSTSKFIKGVEYRKFGCFFSQFCCVYDHLLWLSAYSHFLLRKFFFKSLVARKNYALIPNEFKFFNFCLVEDQSFS